jgi:hypothetical protein
MGAPLSGGSQIRINGLHHGVSHATSSKLSKIRNIWVEVILARLSNSRHFENVYYYKVSAEKFLNTETNIYI